MVPRGRPRTAADALAARMGSPVTKTVLRVPKAQARRARMHAHNDTYKLALPPGPGYDDKFVPGKGDMQADVMFIGEAPGKEEAWLGEPFVGRSGALLDELFEAVWLRREDTYITNIVKYRPPNNADPDQTTAQAALALMRMEIKIVRPKLIVPMGRYACMLWWPDPVMQMIAGQRWMKQGQVVVPMYHPSWALRNGAKGRAAVHMGMRTVRETLDAVMRYELPK